LHARSTINTDQPKKKNRQYRREVLKATGADLNAELSYIASLLVETPKNYQLWYHRQVLVALLHDASNEPAFLRTILLDDGKNYHAWGFRYAPAPLKRQGLSLPDRKGNGC